MTEKSPYRPPLIHGPRGAAYVASVTRTWRAAIDRLRADPAAWTLQERWQSELSAHAEGHQTTLGPYHRSWH